MFNEGKACVVKMNPVNAYLGPYLEQAYAAAIREGFLAILYGGADEGAYLATHSGLDEIHVTGSNQTYDRMVWGPPGPERERRKAEGRPLLAKPITAELGNVSPVIVVPGPYSDRQLAYQAADVAGALTYNASFDCNAAKVVMTSDKAEKKLYYRHSGHPGSLTSRTYAELLATRPEETVRRAVRGMLPKGPLGRRTLKKLKVYAGPDHPHTAQDPQPLPLEGARSRPA